MNEASPEPDSAAPHALAKPLTLAATIAALGVVFGDIGTSPLYAFKECLRVKDAAGNFVGVSMVVPTLSLIIWSLILVVMFKYVLLVMEANEDGEGGIMTLVSLASMPWPRFPTVFRFGRMRPSMGQALRCWVPMPTSGADCLGSPNQN